MTKTPTQRRTLHIGHSPDPDDAFMWYPLANFPNHSGPNGKTYTPTIDTGPYDFVHVLEDIQSLNERAERAELEITAISIHQYPYVSENYALTSCGSSMGDNYGPMVVSREKCSLDNLRKIKIAIPGERTTAFLALSLLLGKDSFDYETLPFDQIIPAVASGKFEAGLIIHEGQLTYEKNGLHCIVDLGKWWTQSRNLPLPLGGNAIRRDLAQEMGPICRVLLNSIQYALEHRTDAVQYALNYARDMGADLADEFIGMYVNQWTLDYSTTGRQAVQRLMDEASKAGLIPPCGTIEFVEPG